MNICERSKHPLNIDIYKDADLGFPNWYLGNIETPKEQMILRMLIKHPDTFGFVIPEELKWIQNTLYSIVDYQESVFNAHPFCYVTVRCGEVTTTTDDEWHVDGFSMRIPHVPEQNWIWSNCYPTEVLAQNFIIPNDFDPFKHNIHQYFQDNLDKTKIQTLCRNQLYVIDPYVVHRRPKVPIGTNRCFFRISFVPIEIKDDTSTPNPLLRKKVYNREDIRKSLIRY